MPSWSHLHPESMSKQELVAALKDLIAEQESAISTFDSKLHQLRDQFREIQTKLELEQQENNNLHEEIARQQKEMRRIKTEIKLLKSENFVLRSRAVYHDEEMEIKPDALSHSLREKNSFLEKQIQRIRDSVCEFINVVGRLFTGNDLIENAFLQELFILKENLR